MTEPTTSCTQEELQQAANEAVVGFASTLLQPLGWDGQSDPKSFVDSYTESLKVSQTALPEGKHVEIKGDVMSMRVWVFAVVILFAVIFGLGLGTYFGPTISRQFSR